MAALSYERNLLEIIASFTQHFVRITYKIVEFYQKLPEEWTYKNIYEILTRFSEFEQISQTLCC